MVPVLAGPSVESGSAGHAPASSACNSDRSNMGLTGVFACGGLYAKGGCCILCHCTQGQLVYRMSPLLEESKETGICSKGPMLSLVPVRSNNQLENKSHGRLTDKQTRQMFTLQTQ